MRHIAYLKSPVCAVDRLNEAILTGNAELFDAVFPQDASRDFALRLADTIPPEFLSQRDPQILAQYMRELLTALLRGDPAVCPSGQLDDRPEDAGDRHAWRAEKRGITEGEYI